MTKIYLSKIIILILILLSSTTKAQDKKLYFKFDLMAGIGSTWHTINYTNPITYDEIKILYSPGGGIGLGIGGGYNVAKSIAIEGSVSYQQVIGLQSHNGYTSSVLFNRKTFLGGAKYKIPLGKNTDPVTFNLGAGAGYIIPGSLIRVQNDESLGTIKYKGTIPVYGLAEIEYPIGGVSLRGGLRYRSANFKATSFTNGSIESLESRYKVLVGSGFDLLLGLSF